MAEKLQPSRNRIGGLNLPDGFFRELPINKVVPGRNPRQSVEKSSISKLAESIRRNGLLQPIVVQPLTSKEPSTGARELQDEQYVIICGERRYRAAVLAGLETIAAIVREPEDDGNALVLALVENLEREELNPIEQARAFVALKDLGYTQSQIGKLVGCAQPTVANALRLLRLPEPIQQKIATGAISASHGKELLRWVRQPELLAAQAAHAEDGASTKSLVSLATNDPEAAPKRLRRKAQFGEPLDFRGLRFAPINEQGVVYLFGMVSRELGFLIESVRTSYPDCEGKRCVGKDGRRWEHVLVEFEYKSSNFRDHGHCAEECDLIVCWIHDWLDCPVEVMELRSEIKRLLHN